MHTTFHLLKTHGWRRYIRYLRHYKKKKNGRLVNFRLPYADGYFPEDIGTTEIHTMKNGRSGVFEITGMRGIDDFGSENITFDFIGYVNEKPIRECSLKEFMQFYHDYLSI